MWRGSTRQLLQVEKRDCGNLSRIDWKKIKLLAKDEPWGWLRELESEQGNLPFSSAVIKDIGISSLRYDVRWIIADDRSSKDHFWFSLSPMLQCQNGSSNNSAQQFLNVRTYPHPCFYCIGCWKGYYCINCWRGLLL